MIQLGKNVCYIEGILSEIDLREINYTNKTTSKPMEAIGGEIKILTEQVINGKERTVEIPVRMFANKFTKNGTENPAYTSIRQVMTEYVSIQSSSIEKADRVRITSGSLTMNEFYPRGSERLVSVPVVSASFVTRVRNSDYKPSAEFEIEFYVASRQYEVDKNGEETGRYKVTGLVPQFGDTVVPIPFICSNDNVATIVSEYWNEGNTVKATGKLLFTTESQDKVVENDFGEPSVRSTTTNISELIITGGKQEPYDDDFGFDAQYIKDALAKRKVMLESKKDAAKAAAAPKAATKATSAGFNMDLGF